MKETRGYVAVLVVSMCLLMSCSREKKDSEIKADISTKAKTTYAFAGVNYVVLNGVVELTGVCPTEKEKEEVESTVRKIAGVKDVTDAITLGQVTLDENFFLKQSVDSAIKNYNLVTAQVKNRQVTLTGKAKAKQIKELTKALEKLPVAGVDNQVTVQ